MKLDEANFEGLSTNFPNIKSITLQYEGISGSVTQQTFKGLENIETIRIIDTYIESIEQRSFVNLDVVKGNIYFSLNKIDCKNYLEQWWRKVSGITIA